MHMGLLDSVLGSAIGSMTGGQGGGNAGLAKMAIDMIGGRGNLGGAVGALGGLGGIVKALEGQGLGSIVQSWISTGPNLPVSPGQVQQALGPAVQQMAQQHGMSTDAVSGVLAKMLPELINHVTPTGQLPQAGPLESNLSSLIKQFGL
jgi:uncharacterized protein YidB (DUF937 family)